MNQCLRLPILSGLVLWSMVAIAQVPPGMVMKPVATPLDSHAVVSIASPTGLRLVRCAALCHPECAHWPSACA